MYVGVVTTARGSRTTMAASEPSASSGSSLSERDSAQVSDLVTGNTSTGSESGVQSLLDRLKAP